MDGVDCVDDVDSVDGMSEELRGWDTALEQGGPSPQPSPLDG